MVTTLTRKDASVLLRTKIVRDDANDFEKTESSSGAPLKVKTSVSVVLDDKRILSLDASLRRSEIKADAEDDDLIPTGYKVPEGRVIRYETLDEAFASRNRAAVEELLNKAFSLYPDLVPTGATIEPLSTPASFEDLAMPVKSLDFSLDVKKIFMQLDEPKVIYVDAPNDAYVGLMIVGKAADGLVIAQTLLVQT